MTSCVEKCKQSLKMRLKTKIVTILLICCLLIASMVFYFIIFSQDLQNQRPPKKKKSLIIVPFTEVKNGSSLASISAQIMAKQKTLDLDFMSLKPMATTLVESLKRDLLVDGNEEPAVWPLAQSWITARAVIGEKTPLLGHVLRALERDIIIGADLSKKGTQLKLSLELKGKQKVFFKPKRYSRDHVVDGVYAGFDRHNGEIIAFHLSRLLDMRFAPVVASRRIHIAREVAPVASAALLATFTNSSCFYGECYYCNPADVVCVDTDGRIEGAVVLLLPTKYALQRVRNPWQRTYRSGVPALWETEMDFCENIVRKRIPLRPRLLDLMDTAIFDFLLGNGDRHHLEVFKDVPNSAVLLIDNGKSFGNPWTDEWTIVLPLIQCCFVRNSTFQRLKLVKAFGLSRAIGSLLAEDILWPLLTRPHLDALDRRLETILSIIDICFDKKGEKVVLK